MPEYLSWIEFYKLYPFDDYHRFYRPAALIASSFGGEVQPKLDWLQPEPAPTGQYSSADLATFKALGMPTPPSKRKKTEGEE